jgi:alanine racemase
MLTWIELNKQNLLYNIQQFKNIAPQSAIWPVVKSNAYGHGVKEVVEILDQDKNTTGFMVVNLSEALELANYTDKNILVLSYFGRAEESLKLAADKKISLPVCSLECVDYLDSLNKKFLVNIKIDTGTTRLGFAAEESEEIIKYIQNKKNLSINSIYTHYAESESANLDFTKQQFELFDNIASKYPEIKKHSVCSAAAISMPEAQADMIRLGISLYGLWPSQETKDRNSIDLKPVLSWHTKIIQIKNIKAGQSIGYNRTYKCEQDCKIAILPVGYYEGYSRSLSNKSQVIIKNKKYSVRGNVCMNLIMIELPADTDIKVGEVVTLLGRQNDQEISVEELAQLSSTINYEVVTKINAQLPRVIV